MQRGDLHYCCFVTVLVMDLPLRKSAEYLHIHSVSGHVPQQTPLRAIVSVVPSSLAFCSLLCLAAICLRGRGRGGGVVSTFNRKPFALKPIIKKTTCVKACKMHNTQFISTSFIPRNKTRLLFMRVCERSFRGCQGCKMQKCLGLKGLLIYRV